VPQFRFRPQWKEELVCECDLGSLTLEMTMGVTAVYLPAERSWPTFAPDWAKPYWPTLHEQLRAWCSSQNIPFHLDE
jgi:hypothetical protein